TIDLRSLALFRIVLASLLIADWRLRWPNLEAFYTSFGLVPIESPLFKAGGGAHFSLLDSATSLPMVQLFFLMGLGCYLLFLLGFRTRLCHFLSLLFFMSVCNRSLILRQGVDRVLLTMLFWSVFVPLGERFSVDAILCTLRSGRLRMRW